MCYIMIIGNFFGGFYCYLCEIYVVGFLIICGKKVKFCGIWIDKFVEKWLIIKFIILGLVDFVDGLVEFIFYLFDGWVKVFGEIFFWN